MQTKSALGALFVLAYICNKLKSSVNCTGHMRRILNARNGGAGGAGGTVYACLIQFYLNTFANAAS